MILLLRLFLSALLALAASFAFSLSFLDLLDRSATDQALLVSLPAAALGWLIFSALGNPEAFRTLRLPKFEAGSFQARLREHAPGMALALLFFAAYAWYGLQLNFSDSDTTDNFLDADNYPWMIRIAYPEGHLLEMRGPHPFAYFLLRPFGWLLNLVTSDPHLSAVLLNTLVGALCVFMAWVFIKRQSQNTVYALLIASLLGLSTSHFFFGAVIESYIFSAAALIGFVLALQKSNGSLFAPVAMGVVTFGITLTNFVQNFIGFVVAQLPNLSRKTFRDAFVKVFRFTAFALSIGIVLSVLHATWYPSSRLFFQLSDAQIEQDFSNSLFDEPQWKITGRIILLVRTILLYTVIAPKPFVFGKEVGAWLPYFNFFKLTPQVYSYSAYDGLGSILIFVWAGLLLLSGIFFLWNLIRTRKADLSLAFALSLLFNFLLHVNYGFEPFLYSPDWAYALIFFVGLSLAPLARSRLFQGALLVFLVLLAYNQVQLFQFILDTIAPFYYPGG
jgi:hypothetical protein